jgi:hypothetical protein
VMLFTISAAPGTPPSITSISPNSAPFCGSASGFPLIVSGTGLTSDSVVNWNGSPRIPTVVNSTQTPATATATILPLDTTVSSPVTVTVSNSSGTSNALQFTIGSPSANLPAPQLAVSAVSPATALAGSVALPITITANSGTTFLPCTVVKWASSSLTATLPTAYVPATSTTSAQLTATIPATGLQTAGTASITLFTPGPGGGTSQAVSFTITQAPTPTISSVSVAGSTPPATSTPSCSATGFTLQVNGTNFVNGSVVDWNGSSRPTTFVSTTQLTALIPYTDTIMQGTATITVSSGSAVSNSASFSVAVPPSPLPAPTVSTTAPIAPSSAMVGSGPFTLTVTGANFVPCSFIKWNGSQRTTTYLNPTQLSTPILAADLTSAGMVPVTVVTPAPGGGTVAAGNFTISGLSISAVSVLGSSPPAASTPYCSPTGFTLDVTSVKATPTTSGTTFTSDTVVNWNGSPRPTTFVSATELQAAITYADTAFPGSVSVTVSNSKSTSAAASFSLSAPTSLPVPSINVPSPSHAAAGGPAFTLSVTGSGLLPCSAVQWNGSMRTTTFTSVNGLTAAISAADIATASGAQVTVNTPAPSGCTVGTGITCGGTSNSETFTVYVPVAGAVRSAAMLQQADIAGGSGARSAPLLSLHLMSADHRYAVHVLASTDGVTEIPGTTQNIFVRDTCAGAPSGCVPSEKLVSIGVGGNLADGGSFSPSISADGRYVAFLSSARNLVNVGTSGVADVFVRDTCAGAAAGCTPSTQRVSVASDGTEADGSSASATIDATGRYITFESFATNLGSSSISSSAAGLFLRDTCAGANPACVPSTQPTQ